MIQLTIFQMVIQHWGQRNVVIESVDLNSQ